SPHTERVPWDDGPNAGPSSAMWSLVVEWPEKHRNQAVNFHPKEHQVIPEPGKKGLGGRGHGIFLGPLSTAPLLFADGPPERMAVRRDDDRDLALEVNHRKFKVDNPLSFWANGFGENCKREWAAKFCLHSDGTISPESQDHLVLGVRLNEHGVPSVVLVEARAERRLALRGWKSCAVLQIPGEGLEGVTTRGMDALPTGPKTDDELFKRQVVHCTGKAGDVYIANYMTAHLVAPNTSSDIRYACYFRFKGPGFNDDLHQPASMLDPLLHWHLKSVSEGTNSAEGSKPKLRTMKTMEEAEANLLLEDYYASSNNDHTARAG
ncbi:unnamed protein product, partial [Durusdinium trenchii]